MLPDTGQPDNTQHPTPVHVFVVAGMWLALASFASFTPSLFPNGRAYVICRSSPHAQLGSSPRDLLHYATRTSTSASSCLWRSQDVRRQPLSSAWEAITEEAGAGAPAAEPIYSNAAAAVVTTTLFTRLPDFPRPPPRGTSLTIAILTSALGELSQREQRKVARSEAHRDLEKQFREGGAGAAKAEGELWDLLQAAVRLFSDGDGNFALKMVLACPELLLADPQELMASVQELRDMVSAS